MSSAQSFIDVILERLFAPSQRNLVKIADKLIESHFGPQATYQQKGLAFSSGFILHSSTPAQKRGQLNDLAQVSDEDMDGVQSYIDVKSRLEDDMVAIKQGLVALLGGMKSEANIRNALPDWLLNAFLPNLPSMYERTAEPGYTLLSKPGGALRFQKLENRMRSYYALQMVL